MATDPDKNALVFENEHVRVLRYHGSPGAKTALHRHDDFVLYAFGRLSRRLAELWEIVDVASLREQLGESS